MKKILVPGGTGAMGQYLVPLLLKKGYKVDVCSLDDAVSDDENLRYIKINLREGDNLEKIISNGYDGIIDFMIWYPHEFDRIKYMLARTEHYVYLSSYRIYADEEHPVKETSPRLLDVATSEEFLARKESEYSLYKAMGEDMLRSSGYKNYTIVRPSITFSKRRYQLTTLEADIVVRRIFEGKTVVLPQGAMDKQATMTWAGDTAKFFAAVIFNKAAFGEAYSFATSEHHTWREVAEIYNKIFGLRYIEVPDEDYIGIIADNDDFKRACRWQLKYDREFDRVMDNSKILALAGLSPSDLMPLETALKFEYANLPRNAFAGKNEYVNSRMDEYLKAHGYEK